MTVKKHHVRYTFWTMAAIGIGIGVAWFSFGGIHTVSAFIMQRTVNQQQFESNELAYSQQQTQVTYTKEPVDEYTVSGELKKIDAESYLVGDIETGEIIAERDADTSYPIASISKLVTAMVAYDTLNLMDTAIVSRDATHVESARGGLQAGEKLRVLDLLYPLMLVSSNDAADVLAEKYGYDAFIALMNKKVQELNLGTTSFEDPSGLSEHNVSSARDLFTILRHVKTDYPEIIDITTTDNYKIKNHSWRNQNKLKDTFEFRGGKTGYTSEARYTSAAYYSVPISGTNRYIAVIILASDDRTNDIEKILNFVQNNVTFSIN